MCLLHYDPDMFIFLKLYWVVYEMIHQFYAFHHVSSVTAFVYQYINISQIVHDSA